MRLAPILKLSALSILSTSKAVSDAIQSEDMIQLGFYSSTSCSGNDVDFLNLTGMAFYNCFRTTVKRSISVTQTG